MSKIAMFLTATVLIGLTGCTGSGDLQEDYTETPASVYYEYSEDLDSVEDIIRYSTNIVEATLVSVEDFNGNVSVYSFDIDKDFTENTEDKIHMYDAYNEQYVVGHSYYLFLCGTDSALYPHKIYTTVQKELIFDTESVQPESAIDNNVIDVDMKQMDAVISKAIKSDIVGAEVGQGTELSKATSISEVSEEAEVVAEIRVSEENKANIYASTYKIELVKLLKGSEGAIAQHMSLPPNLDENSSYYIFLTESGRSEGAFVLLSREYPVSEVNEQTTSELCLS